MQLLRLAVKCIARPVCAATHVTIVALFCGSSLLRSSNCVWAAEYEAGQLVSANGNEESTGENCNLYILVENTITPYSCTIKLQYILPWRLLTVCAACPTPRLNQSYELRAPWEQHLRYVPHRVRNGYNSVHRASVTDEWMSSEHCWVLTGENRNIREKFVPMVIGPPQVLHGLCGVIT